MAQKGRRALAGWGLADARIGRNLGGSANASWLVRADGGTFVLRGVEGDRDYLDYQVTVLSHLRKSNFAVAVPDLRPSLDGAYVHVSDEIAWILYPYLQGQPPAPVRAPEDAASLGALVASFDAAVANLDLGARTGCFALPLFQRQAVVTALSPPPAHLDRETQVLLPAILRAYEAIPETIIDAVARLPRQSIYNDWHRWNLLQSDGQFSGLVDFDSLVEAPRVVDFQNALGHLLMDQDAPEPALIEAFVRGYAGQSPISPQELALAWPLMMDQLLSLAAAIAGHDQPGARQLALAARAVRVADSLRRGRLAQP